MRWLWALMGVLCMAVPGECQLRWEPVLPAALPDPDPYFEDGYWYVFGTDWACYVGTELAPDKMERVPLELDFGEEGGPYQVWRFTVYKHTDGSYHAYTAIHYGYFKTATAHFVPAEGEEWRPGEPISKWVLERVLVGRNSPEGPWAYDLTAVRDEDDTLYLLYCTNPPGTDDIHIMAQRMLDPYEPDPDFQPRPILSPEGFRSEDRNPGYKQIVEGAHIARRGGKWVLTYSVGDFALYPGHPSNYKLGVAYSDTLIPPEGETYQKVLMADPNDVWGSGRGEEVRYILQSQIEDWPNYCGEWVEGPGLGSIVDIDGEPWLLFHGYITGDRTDYSPDSRYDWVLPLVIDIDESKPMSEWVRVVLPG